MTITERHTSPLSWPSCLCSAPVSSPGAHPPPRPCGGQRSKGQMRWEQVTHTHQTQSVPLSRCRPWRSPVPGSWALTSHLAGTLVVDGAANLEEIPPTRARCGWCRWACRLRASWIVRICFHYVYGFSGTAAFIANNGRRILVQMCWSLNACLSLWLVLVLEDCEWLTASPGRPGPWPARLVCWPVSPARPAAAALVSSGPPSSASLQQVQRNKLV